MRRFLGANGLGFRFLCIDLSVGISRCQIEAEADDENKALKMVEYPVP